MNRADHIGILSLTAAMSGFLGIIILIKKRDKSHELFGCYSLSISWWSFFQMLMIWDLNPDTSVLWSRVEQIGVVFIPTLFVHFVALFLKKTLSPWLIKIMYGLSIGFAILAPFTKLIISYVPWRFNRMYFGTGGVLYPCVILFFLSGILGGLWMLLGSYRHASFAEKNRLKYLLWGSALGYSGGALNFLMVYGIQVYPYNPYCTLFVPIYVAVVTYAILRHRLLDINVIIRKTLIYSVVTGVLTIVYLGVVAVSTRLFEGLAGYQTIYSAAVAACLIGVFFQPLRLKVQTIIDTKFFRQYVDREEKLYELSREVITHTTPEAMAQSLIRVLADTLHPKSAAIYLKAREGAGFINVAELENSSLPSEMSENNPLANYFLDHPQPFVQEIPSKIGEPFGTRRPPRSKEAA